MNWYTDEDIASNFLSCKQGEKLRVKVKEIRKIVGGYSKFHYKKKDGNPILTKETKEPMHHELEAEDGRVLTIGSISLIAALRNAKVDSGDEIEIDHSGRGKYEIRILDKAPAPGQIEIEEPIDDKPLPF